MLAGEFDDTYCVTFPQGRIRPGGREMVKNEALTPLLVSLERGCGNGRSIIHVGPMASLQLEALSHLAWRNMNLLR